jgi:hypothetical protein
VAKVNSILHTEQVREAREVASLATTGKSDRVLPPAKEVGLKPSGVDVLSGDHGTL